MEIGAERIRTASRIPSTANGKPVFLFDPDTCDAVSAAEVLPGALAGCYKSPEPPAAEPANATGPGAPEILKKSRPLSSSKDSAIKMQARITDLDAASASPVQVELTIQRKRADDGGESMLVEFHGEERDRSALVVINPIGEAEGVRYVQSNDTFVTTRGVTTEESLFGMTMQELADGQPEKYDFTLAGGASHLHRKCTGWKEGSRGASSQSSHASFCSFQKRDSAALAAEFYDNRTSSQGEHGR